MATFFGSPPFISHPIARTQHLSSSSQPPPLPPSQPPSQPLPLGKSERGGKAKGTSVDSTDWIASSLTRRFGLGAGLGWAAFLAFGVVSEQIKIRFEVTQQQANTRDVEMEEEVVLPNGIRHMRVFTYDLMAQNPAYSHSGGGTLVPHSDDFLTNMPLVFARGLNKKERKSDTSKPIALSRNPSSLHLLAVAHRQPLSLAPLLALADLLL